MTDLQTLAAEVAAGGGTVSGVWYVVNDDDWTLAARVACARRCDYDPPCWTLGNQGLVGGEIEAIKPCDECAKEAGQ